MKKLLLLFAAIGFGTSFGIAQYNYTVSDLDGNNYTNGGVYTYDIHGTFEDPLEEAKLHLVLKNISSETVRLSAQVMEIQNTDGTKAQFCIGGIYGNCYFPVYEGEYYPVNNEGFFPIEPGEIQSTLDYFINLDGDDDYIRYVFRFFETDEDGFEIEGTTFTLTYEYEKPMSVKDLDKNPVAEIYPTVISGSATLELTERAAVNVIGMDGRIVKTMSLESGKSNIDLSGIASGVYMIQVKGMSGKSLTKRVVVK